MKILMDSKTVKKVSKQLNNHLKTLKHQPLAIDLNVNDADVEMIINSEESRLRIDFYIEKTSKKELLFTEEQLQDLQKNVHNITGDGKVMQLFNGLLDVNAAKH